MENLKDNVSQTYLENVLIRMPGSIYWKDKNGKYLGCNDFQAKMAGFNSPEDIIGKTDYDLPWKGIADILNEVDQRIILNGTPEELIETPTLPDGTKLIMLTNKSPLYSKNGEIIGIIGTSLDITARKQAEEREKAALIEVAASEANVRAEEEAKRALMVLAGSIAHDLRTPLFLLLSIAHELNRSLPTLYQFYEVAKNAGLDIGKKLTKEEINNIDQIMEIPIELRDLHIRLNSFINENLKAIKQSTSSSLREEDLVECLSYKSIGNALEAYPFKIGERELIQWDQSYYFNFLGNPVLFLRILFNLINNSLYQIHTNGKGKIFISCEEQPECNIIRFKDTAGGASSDIMEHIFDGYKTTKKEGTGVGLAFCKLTMESFGGSIKCHSIYGDFIEFVLTFPKTEQKTNNEIKNLML